MSNDCGEGKLCSFDTYTCVEVGSLPVALGGVCQVDSFQLPCTDGLLCLSNEDGSRTCQAPAKLGDPCPDYSCPGADLNCNFDTFICESNAGVGESCLGVSCAEGLYCDGGQDSTCVAQYGPGEGCASSVVCAENGQCINNFCQEPAPLVCYYG